MEDEKMEEKIREQVTGKTVKKKIEMEIDREILLEIQKIADEHLIDFDLLVWHIFNQYIGLDKEMKRRGLRWKK